MEVRRGARRRVRISPHRGRRGSAPAGDVARHLGAALDRDRHDAGEARSLPADVGHAPPPRPDADADRRCTIRVLLPRALPEARTANGGSWSSAATVDLCLDRSRLRGRPPCRILAAHDDRRSGWATRRSVARSRPGASRSSGDRAPRHARWTAGSASAPSPRSAPPRRRRLITSSARGPDPVDRHDAEPEGRPAANRPWWRAPPRHRAPRHRERDRGRSPTARRVPACRRHRRPGPPSQATASRQERRPRGTNTTQSVTVSTGAASCTIDVADRLHALVGLHRWRKTIDIDEADDHRVEQQPAPRRRPIEEARRQRSAGARAGSASAAIERQGHQNREEAEEVDDRAASGQGRMDRNPT